MIIVSFQKRILLHFKAKRKEEFSAMGFFNFDYPLLCSVIIILDNYKVYAKMII